MAHDEERLNGCPIPRHCDDYVVTDQPGVADVYYVGMSRVVEAPGLQEELTLVFKHSARDFLDHDLSVELTIERLKDSRVLPLEAYFGSELVVKLRALNHRGAGRSSAATAVTIASRASDGYEAHGSTLMNCS